MRIKLTFYSEEPLIIPTQYNYAIQSMIYDNISQELADFLHNEGFILNGQQFKLFTFSRLEGKFKIRENQKIESTSPVELTVASPIERFLQELADGMLQRYVLILFRQRVYLESVGLCPNIKTHQMGEEVTIKMLSPMVAYQTEKNSGKTIYYTPWDDVFSDLARIDVEKKYQLLTGEKLKNSKLKVIPIGPKDERCCKILSYKNTAIKGWMGIYKLQGNPELIKTAYDAGLGSKNPQGFGCFELVG
ncbi:MAG: CRISPR-associated endoribonuclease Cas6 [Tepidanaerobacteraceae bacterium]|nr:CRISPR-associated endoribonuclease Cas6 [Tepidanaerobacteraceae bacterium]